MPPSIDTGECEKKVVEVVNTEELPLNAPETGEEAKAKPEDLIASGENKSDKTEESAGSEKNDSEPATQAEGDSTPPVVVDQTPPVEMPGNAGEVKEDKCEDVVELEQSDKQNKPELVGEEIRTEETIKESEESELESNEKSADQKPVPAEAEAKEIEVANDDKSEVDVKEHQNMEKTAEESEKSTTEIETADINPGPVEIEVTEPEIIENKSEESDKSSSENETSKDQTDVEVAEPQVEENQTEPKDNEKEIDKANSSCDGKEIPDSVLEKKTDSDEVNETQCEDVKADIESEAKVTESDPVINQEVVEDTLENEEKKAEVVENETPIEKEIVNEKDVQNKTEQVQASPDTIEQPTSDEIKPDENLTEADVKEETKAEVKEEIKADVKEETKAVVKEETKSELNEEVTSTIVESAEKDGSSDGGDHQTSPTLSKNSYDATKEEIEDSINFIKNRLSVADPKIPGETINEENIKKAVEEPQSPSKTDVDSEQCEKKEETKKEMSQEEISKTNTEVEITKTNTEVELEITKTNTEVESPKKDPEVKIAKAVNTEAENPKTNTEVTKKDPEVEIAESNAESENPLAVIECIPPVRPERQKKQSVKIPEWSPPKNNFFSYLFGCFKPRQSD